MADASSSLTISVVTPEETLLEQQADSIVLPLFDGEIGILKGHSPMIGRLGYGELRVTRGGETSHFYVDGGFAQVTDNQVTVLTNHAKPTAQLDADAAREQLSEALARHTTTPVETDLRQRAVDQARARLRLAEK